MKKGYTVWFTGMSGSGKSTLAERLKALIEERGQKVKIFDGDEVRQNLSKGLGFSKEDRDINIRRVGYVCNLVTDFGGTAIAACISPYQEIRDENRALIGNFVEVYCECPLEVLQERDVKGLYAKAAKGEVKDFTGVHKSKHAGYEPPPTPEVVVHTDREKIEESLGKILAKLEDLGYLPRLEVYSDEEEETIRKRLESLGYL